VKPLQRLDSPILEDSTPDAFNQFLAVGLHPLDLSLSLQQVHLIHRNLFTDCSIYFL
jgi:hypothetical protein